MESKKEESFDHERFVQAQHMLIRLLAQRDHSPQELRTKLTKNHDTALVNQVLDWAIKTHLLPDDPQSLQRLADQISLDLHRQKKGIAYINNKLDSIGLPPVVPVAEQELEKAQALIQTKFAKADHSDPKVIAKAHRFLMSRGFSSEIIDQMLKMYFATSLPND